MTGMVMEAASSTKSLRGIESITGFGFAHFARPCNYSDTSNKATRRMAKRIDRRTFAKDLRRGLYS